MLKYLLLTFLFVGTVFSQEQYLLPKDHPLQEKLSCLFQDEQMFESRYSWQRNGFVVLGRIHFGLMVAKHPSIPGYLFKKFQDKISLEYQLENYIKRIEGARALKEFIEENNLKHIVVPEKWLYELPKGYILIVEKMDICRGGKDPKGEVAQKYFNIDKEILRELCLVLSSFRGLDSMLHNLPFTYQNKIAFVDTEKWAEKRKGILQNILPYLKDDRRKYALKLMEALR